MILTPAATRSFATFCASLAGTAITPTMMFFSCTVPGSASYPETGTFPTVRPTLAVSLSNTAAMFIPCSAKIGELAIASPRRPAPTSAMLCCPCVRTILRISERSESML